MPRYVLAKTIAILASGPDDGLGISHGAGPRIDRDDAGRSQLGGPLEGQGMLGTSIHEVVVTELRGRKDPRQGA